MTVLFPSFCDSVESVTLIQFILSAWLVMPLTPALNPYQLFSISLPWFLFSSYDEEQNILFQNLRLT